MKRAKLAVWVLLLTLFIAPGAVWSQASSEVCSQIVDAALRSTSDLCQDTGRNEACYGHVLVNAYPQPGVDELVFHEEGDIAGLIQLQSMELSAMDPDTGFWGVLLMRVQANLPDERPGQNVTLLTFGDVSLQNAVTPAATVEVTALDHLNVRHRPDTEAYVPVALQPGQTVTANGRLADGRWLRITIPQTGDSGWIASQHVDASTALESLPVVEPNAPYHRSLQAFYFQSGSQEAPCPAAAESGLLIQTPAGVGEVRFLINEVSIRLGSTAFLQAAPGQDFAFYLLEGWAQMEAYGVIQTLFPGTRVRIPLDEDLHAAGAPSIPESYQDLTLEALPIAQLPRAFQPAPSMTASEIETQMMALAAVLNPPVVAPTPEPEAPAALDSIVMAESSGRSSLPPYNLLGGRSNEPGSEDNGSASPATTSPPPPPPPLPPPLPPPPPPPPPAANCQPDRHRSLRCRWGVHF